MAKPPLKLTADDGVKQRRRDCCDDAGALLICVVRCWRMEVNLVKVKLLRTCLRKGRSAAVAAFSTTVAETSASPELRVDYTLQW